MGILSAISREKTISQAKLKNNALAEAQHIARILVKRFGAREVILYGSLQKKAVF